MHPIGEITSSKDDTFIVHAGISDSLLDQLVAFSTSDDPDLRAFTGDAKRFMSSEDTKQWIQDSARKIYTLTPESNVGSLAGFGWLRGDDALHTPDAVTDEERLKMYQQSSQDMRHTVAARIYGKYRGMKLATPFMKLAYEDYMKQVQSDVALILADIHADNIPSQMLFQRLGYFLLGPKGDRTLWMLEAKK